MNKSSHFRSVDGYELAATIYEPEQGATCGILITAGTGFPQRLYTKMATWLAARGARVMTFDYRGIGGSRPGDLASLEMDYADWGRKDQEAAGQHLKSLCPDLPLYHVAHSVGGLHFGFCESFDLFDRHAFLSVGVGSVMTHKWWFIPAALTLWYLVGPWHLWRQGYVAKGRWWTGEDLPRGVYRDWRRWCHQRGYMNKELEGPLKPHWYDQVSAPIQSWAFTDDPIATPEASRRALAMYPEANTGIIIRSPKDFGVRSIAHSGAFSSKAMALWPEVWDWLEKGRRPKTVQPGEGERRERARMDEALADIERIENETRGF